MNYYPFRKFKLNKRHLFPVLNKEDLYPQHKTNEEKEFLNQIFKNVRINFVITSNLLIPSRNDNIQYVELTLESGEIIRIKNELFSEHINNITIKKGLIEEGLIFVSCGLELNVVFEGEENFSFYYTELLSQGNSDIFKLKDLTIGSVCSILHPEESNGVFVYIGTYYLKKFVSNFVPVNNRNDREHTLFIKKYLKPSYVFKYFNKEEEHYFIKKDLKNVHKHCFIKEEEVLEEQEICFQYCLLTKNQEYSYEEFLNLLNDPNSNIDKTYFSFCGENTSFRIQNEVSSSSFSRKKYD